MESVTDFHIRMCVDIAVFGDREAINAYSYFLIFETYWRVSVFFLVPWVGVFRARLTSVGGST